MSPVKIRKKVEVSCSSCGAVFLKRTDAIKGWSGYCTPCGNNLRREVSGEKHHLWRGGLAATLARQKLKPPVKKIRKTTEVSCANCQKKYLKRVDTMRDWNGLCRLCASIKAASSEKFRAAQREANVKMILANGGRHPNMRCGFGAESAAWKGGKSKCVDCGASLSNYDSERCKKCVYITPEFGAKTSAGKIGKKFTNAHRSALSVAKGGDGNLDRIKRSRWSPEYLEWRTSVFKRDNYTCQDCGARCAPGVSVVLNADHVRPWSEFPELRFDISNGRTLCVPCHKKTDTFGCKQWQSVRNLRSGIGVSNTFNVFFDV